MIRAGFPVMGTDAKIAGFSLLQCGFDAEIQGVRCFQVVVLRDLAAAFVKQISDSVDVGDRAERVIAVCRRDKAVPMRVVGAGDDLVISRRKIRDLHRLVVASAQRRSHDFQHRVFFLCRYGQLVHLPGNQARPLRETLRIKQRFPVQFQNSMGFTAESGQIVQVVGSGGERKDQSLSRWNCGTVVQKEDLPVFGTAGRGDEHCGASEKQPQDLSHVQSLPSIRMQNYTA